jgi:leucyl-tRNA synthetase
MVPPGAGPGDGGVDLYVGGVEHAVLHLLYARFWHKVLYDLGHVSTREPFRRLFNQGYILADAYLDARGMYVPAGEVVTAPGRSPQYQGQPVNAISPDDIYAAYGADTLRLHEMAMGPLDADRPWRTNDIIGVHRFLQRLWRTIIDEDSGALRLHDQTPDDETIRLLHHTVKVVRRDMQNLRFNTAIARLMELNTHAAKLLAAAGVLPRELAEPLVLMVAPFAPHIAEELWSKMGHAASLACVPFPQFDDSLAAEQVVTLPVQMDGKTRFRIEVPADAGEEEIAEATASHPDYARHTGGATISRLVIVPGRIVNIVTRS